MGEGFEEVLRREELVRQRDLIAQWTDKDATLFYADDGVYARPAWGKRLLKLIDASEYLFPEDAE